MISISPKGVEATFQPNMPYIRPSGLFSRLGDRESIQQRVRKAGASLNPQAVHLFGAKAPTGYYITHSTPLAPFLKGFKEFAGALLNGYDLEGVDFSQANLTGAQLQSTRLRRANFNEATLHGTNLMFSNLSHATLNHARLHQVLANRVTAPHADFSQAHMTDSQFEYAKLNDACFDHARIEASDFSETQQEGTQFRQAVLKAVHFAKARINACFTNATLKNVVFDYGILHKNNFQGASLQHSSFNFVNSHHMVQNTTTSPIANTFIQATLHDVSATGATLPNSRLQGATLDLTGFGGDFDASVVDAETRLNATTRQHHFFDKVIFSSTGKTH